jgi:hypothetical protein
MVLRHLRARGALLIVVPGLALGLGLGGTTAAHADGSGPSGEQARKLARQLNDTSSEVREKSDRKTAAAASVLGDYSGDGKADTLARDSSGQLFLYAGTGNGDAPYQNRVRVGTNWQIYTALVRHGDFTNDGRQDVLGRDAAGVLWVYPGVAGGLGPRQQVGRGWNIYSRLLGVGDWTGDGHDDLAAIDSAGQMFLYRGTGTAPGIFAPRDPQSAGWNGYNTRLSLGDLNADRGSELFTRDGSGEAWLFETSGDPTGPLPLQPRQSLGDGWEVFNLFAATGDLDGGGVPDLIARDSAGFLYLLSAEREDPDPTIGVGWNIYNALF